MVAVLSFLCKLNMHPTNIEFGFALLIIILELILVWASWTASMALARSFFRSARKSKVLALLMKIAFGSRPIGSDMGGCLRRRSQRVHTMLDIRYEVVPILLVIAMSNCATESVFSCLVCPFGLAVG